MTVSRPPGLRVDDEIVVDDAGYTVAGLSGSHARLVDVTGVESSIALADLLRAPGFQLVRRSAAALPPQGLLDSLPADVVEQARWWERHIVEVIMDIPPDAGRQRARGRSTTRARGRCGSGSWPRWASWPVMGARCR